MSERRRARFGDVEVMAYRAVWLKRVGEYAGANQHIRCCKPSSDEVKQWLIENGYVE